MRGSRRPRATQAYTKSIELIADQFREIDLQDGSRDRQLSGKDVRFYLLGAGLSKDQARRVWEQLDENGNVVLDERSLTAATPLGALSPAPLSLPRLDRLGSSGGRCAPGLFLNARS